jgi:hypothetical protein
MLGLRHLLAWCTVINYAILMLWFAVFLASRAWITGMHGRLFDVPVEKIKSVNYLLMGVYKLGILLFNLVPYLALRIMS